jgi:hypothetical protein
MTYVIAGLLVAVLVWLLLYFLSAFPVFDRLPGARPRLDRAGEPDDDASDE